MVDILDKSDDKFILRVACLFAWRFPLMLAKVFESYECDARRKSIKRLRLIGGW